MKPTVMKLRFSYFSLIVLVLLFSCNNYEPWSLYPNGQVKIECQESVETGKGLCRGYREDGTLLSIQEHKVGKRHGKVQAFYKDGSLEQISHYQNDTLDGKYELYDLNGNLTETGSFVNGTKHGIVKKFFDNGELKAVFELKNGKYQGEFVQYFRGGQIKKQLFQTGERLLYDFEADSLGTVLKIDRFMEMDLENKELSHGDTLRISLNSYGPMLLPRAFYIVRSIKGLGDAEGEDFEDIPFEMTDSLSGSFERVINKPPGRYHLSVDLEFVGDDTTYVESTNDILFKVKEE